MTANLGIANHTHRQQIALGSLQGVETLHEIVDTEGETVEVGLVEVLRDGDLAIDVHMGFLLATFPCVLPKNDR